MLYKNVVIDEDQSPAGLHLICSDFGVRSLVRRFWPGGHRPASGRRLWVHQQQI